MVSIIHKTKVGPKGQVVIPKMFRDDMGIAPGTDVVMGCEGGRVVIKKNMANIVELAERLAKGRTNRLSPQKMRGMAALQRWKSI